MRVVRVKGFGDVDQLEIVELPDPVPGEGQVLVRIAAAGMNFSDTLQRAGIYPGGPKPPYFPGIEAAGEVIGRGPEVLKPELGARVVVLGSGGFHASHALVAAHACFPLPPGLSMEQGAAFPISFLTAYEALTAPATVASGDTVLIHAAAGGVGTAALQIVKLLGARVIGAASTNIKRDFARGLGADLVTDYKDIEGACRQFTGGRGPDLILDSLGGDMLRRSLALLPPFGRLVVLGLAGGPARPIDPAHLLFRSKSISGFHLGHVLADAERTRASLTLIGDWLTQGRLKVCIGNRIPLEEIRRAHELLMSRESIGKILLIP